MSQEGYQDTVLINTRFLDNVHRLFWHEFIEYEISIIKILKPAMFCFLQDFSKMASIMQRLLPSR